MAGDGRLQGVAHRTSRGPLDPAAEITKREWSSMPETILASDPSARRTPPTMSICHSSMARARSQRL